MLPASSRVVLGSKVIVDSVFASMLTATVLVISIVVVVDEAVTSVGVPSPPSAPSVVYIDVDVVTVSGIVDTLTSPLSCLLYGAYPPSALVIVVESSKRLDSFIPITKVALTSLMGVCQGALLNAKPL